MILVNMAGFAQSVCPGYFRRNNGNGACADGQVKLYYTTCPTSIPVIDSVYTGGIKSNVTFAAANASQCASQGYISFCVAGGNMPPASNWAIYFHNPGSTDPFGCNVPEGPGGGPLPIILKSFTTVHNNINVILNWQTATEINAQSFEIQKKSAAGFVTINTVAATNKETGSSYSFTDVSAGKTASQYRLKLISRDANVTYSEIHSVRGINGTFDFTVYPNPATRNARISLSDITQPSTILVIDNSGRQLKSISVKSATTLELSDLQPGVYRIRVVENNSGETVTKTLTIVQ